MATEKGWVIVGKHGLYYGLARTRRGAIQERVMAIDEACYEEGWNFGSLTKKQKEAWERCQRDGDRAVLATVTWDCASLSQKDGGG